ncbi:phosphotransferase enzyme family protein [Nocardiopsis dassonvillei]|uniref:phosphotransferase enzyme family protein n=1 Tax=Nocardiopsis dassonvillei TaxID=2014 RepID=UPI00366E9694
MSTNELRSVLAEAYGITDVALERLLLGSQTDNYRAVLPGGQRLFIKAGRLDPSFRYSHTEACSAAELSELARSHGVPAPALHRNREGKAATLTPEGAVTVWDFLDADPQDRPLTPAGAQEAGRALGLLHRRLREAPLQPLRSRGDAWTTKDPAPLLGDARRLVETIDALPCPTPADLERRERLQRRQERLRDLRDLRERLPGALSRGLSHGDYTRVNLLWRGERLVGVLDFQGHDVVLAWELGRIAFDALTAATSPVWRQTALSCAYGYRQANPHLPDEEFLAAPLMMALHALCSLYGVREHYHRPNPVPEVQEDNTRYWTHRDTALTRVLEHLDALRADFTGLL